MEFFDRKEEVIDFQLTPHGRHKLSKGEFVPMYYSFFDEDVIYDVAHSGISETQNDSQVRILDAITPKPFVSFSNRQSGSLDIANFDEYYALNSELGTAQPTQNVPSWEVRFLSGEISASQSFLTGVLGDVPIPQIHMKDLVVNTTVVFPNLSGSAPNTPEFHGALYDDECRTEEQEFEFLGGGEFSVEIQNMLFEIYENNVRIDKKNFDVELFEVENNTLKRLNFFKTTKRIENDILLDEDEIEEVAIENIENSDVEYFFDIFVDKEIDKKEVCERISGKDREQYGSILEDFGCKGITQKRTFPDIYNLPQFTETDECQQF